jgi:hypothetical protein
MAQGSNKSRIIIWTIVGILVVIAVVLLLTGKKGGAATGKRLEKVEDVPAFISRMQGRMDKLRNRVEKTRAEGGNAEVLAQIDEKLGAATTGLQEVQGITDRQQLTDKMEEIRKTFGEAATLMKKADQQEEPAGGE